MANSIFGQTPSRRNPFMDPILLIPVMALTLGLVAAWRYWDNPDAFSSGFEGEQNGFGDLLAELDAAQQDPSALAADIDSSGVLADAFSTSSVEGNNRISPGRANQRQQREREKERKAKSEKILKILNSVSKSPTGGGKSSLPTQLLDSGERGGTRLSLGQFRPDGSFQGRSLSLSPNEQEVVTNAAFSQFRAVQLRNEFIAQSGPQLTYDPRGSIGTRNSTAGASSISLSTGSAILGGAAGYNSRISTVVPPAALANTAATPGYGTPTNRVPTASTAATAPSTVPNLPGYGSTPVGQTGVYTTPGYGLSPTVPSIAGAGPAVAATSGPGYRRGLRNYQLNSAPPPSTGLSTGAQPGFGVGVGSGIQGVNRPTRSLNGPGSLQQQPQPTSPSNVGGRNFRSFSNPYGR